MHATLSKEQAGFSAKTGWGFFDSIVFSDRPELLPILQENGFDLRTSVRNDLTPLCYAAEQKKVQCVKKLLALGADPLFGHVPATGFAISSGNEEIAILLLDAATPKDYKQESDFVYAAVYHSRPKVLRYFLDYGFDPNYEISGADTPLIVACVRSSREIIDLLLHAGADMNAIGHQGLTPLMQAIKFGNTELAHFLLDKGADSSVSSGNGNSALSMFSSGLSKDDPSLVRRLCQNAPNSSSPRSTTPLMSAASGKKPSILMEANTERGYTPIQFAKTQEMYHFLRKRGARGAPRMA